MAKTWANELCPACTDEDLYKNVKEYITNNDVTATEVAMEFDIPLQKVNAWIKEGFIEYKKTIISRTQNILQVYREDHPLLLFLIYNLSV